MSICMILTIPSLICLRSTSDEFISNIIRVTTRVAVVQVASPLRVLHRQAYPGNVKVQHGGAISDLLTMSRGSSEISRPFLPHRYTLTVCSLDTFQEQLGNGESILQ